MADGQVEVRQPCEAAQGRRKRLGASGARDVAAEVQQSEGGECTERRRERHGAVVTDADVRNKEDRQPRKALQGSCERLRALVKQR